MLAATLADTCTVPIGGLALVGLYFFLHIETPKITLMEGLRQIDWSGTLLVVPGTVLFLYGLEVGGVSQPWSSPVTVCCLVFGVVLLVLFLVNERYVPKRPIMPLQIFKNRSNLAALAVRNPACQLYRVEHRLDRHPTEIDTRMREFKALTFLLGVRIAWHIVHCGSILFTFVFSVCPWVIANFIRRLPPSLQFHDLSLRTRDKLYHAEDGSLLAYNNYRLHYHCSGAWPAHRFAAAGWMGKDLCLQHDCGFWNWA